MRDRFRGKRFHTALFSLVLCLLITVSTLPVPDSQTVQATQDPLVVMLDPGHGGNDPGVVRTVSGVQYSERIYNEKLVDACRGELATYDNVLVYVTRVANNHISTYARSTYAKNVGADVFVSFHINSYSSESVGGAEVYTPSGNYRPEVATEAKALANKILANFSSLELSGYGLTGNRLKNRGVKTRLVQNDLRLFYPDGSAGDYYEVIRMGVHYEIPSIIIEHAYITNNADLAMLKDDAALEKLGKATAQAIASQYGLTKTGNSLTQPVLKGQTSAVSLGTVPSGLKVGSAPFTLKASGGSGNGKYVFTSNNPKIIRIEGDQAYIVGAGTVNLTVTRYEDEEYTPRSAGNTSVTVSGISTQLSLSVVDNYRTEDGKQNVVLQCQPAAGGGNGAVPSGIVTFYRNDTKIGTAQFGEDGICTFVAGNLDPGAYTFYASYESGNYDGFTMTDSRSVAFAVTATQATPTPVATPTPEPTATATSTIVPTQSIEMTGPGDAREGFLDILSNKTVLFVFAVAVALILVAIVVLLISRSRENR